jgi:hypothetical protein
MCFVKRTFHFLAFLLGGLVILAASPAIAMPAAPIASGTSPAVNEASNLLQQIHADAYHISNDVNQLKMYGLVPSQVTFSLDGDLVERIISRVNRMDRMLHRLRTAQSEVFPWQREAITRITPAVIELTNYTQDCLNSFDKNRDHLFDSHFEEYVTHMRMTDSRIQNSIQDLDEYASAKHQLHTLKKDLKLRANS